MTTDAEDRSTWPRNGQIIRRAELLRLIEENGGPRGLDLRGARLLGDGPTEYVDDNPLDVSPDALAPLVATYSDAHQSLPPWHAFRGGVALSSALMNGAYLENARLPRADLGGARLRGATLEDADLEHANLVDAHLEEASLQDAKLQRANLLEAQLQLVHAERADLGGARLEDADLTFAVLENSVLRGATLWRANLHAANLQEADLTKADLYKAELRHASLFAADMAEVNLQYADLRETIIEGANLKGARLQGAQLQGVDMYGVQTLEGAHWYGAYLDHTRIGKWTLGKRIGEEIQAREEKTHAAYDRAKEAYLLLKNNFNQIGRYEDASWAYVKEQQMEKMAFHWEWRSHGWKVWRAWGSLWRWLRNWAYELLTGYGERPWNAVGAGVAVVLAFAVGFWAAGIGGGRGAVAFLDCLVYSIATFATFNLARPDLNPTGRGIEIASSLEAILGISVLALVVFTVGNRMSRS